ncbi:GNAT family N-acetyltransferase [Arthrobacter sp. Hz1]
MTIAAVAPGIRASVFDHQLLSRFEVYSDGHVAGYSRYRIDTGQLWILETVIDDRHYKGCHLDKVLMDAVLSSAHRRRLAILPFCPMIRAYLSTQPQYFHLIPQPGADILPQEQPATAEKRYERENYHVSGERLVG